MASGPRRSLSGVAREAFTLDRSGKPFMARLIPRPPNAAVAPAADHAGRSRVDDGAQHAARRELQRARGRATAAGLQRSRSTTNWPRCGWAIASSLFAALRCKHAATAGHSLRVALSASAWAVKLAAAGAAARHDRTGRACCTTWA